MSLLNSNFWITLAKFFIRRLMVKKKNFIYSPANKRMEEEMSKELAPLLGLMLTRKITTRTLIKREFGIDYKTIAKLVYGGKPVLLLLFLN